MKFGDPIWLLVGAAVVVVLMVLRVWLGRRRERELRRFAAERLIPRLTRGISVARRRIKTAMLLLGIACIFLAIARPQWGVRREDVRMRGIDILIALDTSRSMLATDVAPNRLERSKLAIHDFVSTVGAARIGLIPFAGEAFLFCPLTLDRDAFESSLEELDTEIVPEGGTDIARAIREAEKVLGIGADQKILVLITDGEDLEGGAITAAREAAKRGITIHTVGVGTPSGNLIILENGRPLTGPDGMAVHSKLDEKTLREIASATGGMYAPLVGNVAGLEKIRRERLAKVTKTELESQTREIPIERYQWPLGLALLLLAVEFCIGAAARNGRKRITTPTPMPRQSKHSRPATAKSKTTATAAATMLVLAAAVPRVHAADDGAADKSVDPRAVYNEGTELWKEGTFDKAEQKFHDALSTGDLSLQIRAYYNLGNARYRLGQSALAEKNAPDETKKLWEQAIEAYDAALALDPNDDDAAYNREFVRRKLDDLKQQQEEQKEDQKKDQKDKQDQQDSKDQKDQQKNQQNEENKDQEKQQGNQDKDQQDTKDNQDSGDKEEEKNKDGNKPENGGEKPENGDKSEPGDKPENGDKPEKQSEPGKQQSGEQEQQGQADKQQGGEQEQEGQSDKRQGEVDQHARPASEERVPGQMTKEEAKRLLESLANEEGNIRFAVPRRKDGHRRSREPKRDW